MSKFDHITREGRIKTFGAINGAIFYEGPSVIDGSPIIMVAIFKSSNEKTAKMVQTYILRSDVDPIEAAQSGLDISICGGCPHRGEATGDRAAGRSCYVNLGQGPRAVYDGYVRGIYPTAEDFGAELTAEKFAGRHLRMGTYGDPAAVPVEVWARLLAFAGGRATGYTHQWRDGRFQWLRAHAMASCDSVEDYRAAKLAGWRTFRVRRDTDAILATEIVCPASEEAGYRLNCDRCLACRGAGSKASGRDAVIIGHGGIAVLANVGRTLDRLA